MAVNVHDYTVDVMTEGSRALIGVPVMTPMSHPYSMAGINFLPEVGATVVICTMDSGSYFLLGCLMEAGPVRTELSEGPNHTGRRDPIEPGDIVMSTSDGNQVVLRRGGLVQIGANSLSQRMYIPVGNIVRDYFMSYQAYSPLGDIDWGHAELLPETTASGDTAVKVRYRIKRKVQEDVADQPYTLELFYGVLSSEELDTTTEERQHLFCNEGLSDQLSQPGTFEHGSEGTLSLTIYSHDDQAKRVVYAFQVGKDGDHFMMTKGSMQVEVAKKLFVYAGDDIIIQSASNHHVTIKVGGTGQIRLGSETATHPVALGDGVYAYLNSLATAFNTHTHVLAGPVAGASAVPVPPIASPTSGALSSDVTFTD